MSTQDAVAAASPAQDVDVPQLQARIVELEHEVTTLQAQLSEYQTFVDAKDAEIANLRSKIELLESEQSQLQQTVQKAQQQLAELTENAAAGANADAAAGDAAAVVATPAPAAAAAESQEDIDELKEELELLREQVRRQEQLLLQQAASPAVPVAREGDAALVVANPTALVGTNKNTKPGEMTLKMRKNRQEKLMAVRAQITSWLNRILTPDPTLSTEDLMERLATGVIICNLAIVVSDTAIPVLGRVHLKAQAYSILAHENVLSFLRVCYEWGLKRVECFGPQDLLNTNKANRNERLVVETLLSLSRVVYLKFGIEPPWMVKAEIAIDEADQAATSNQAHHDMMNENEHEKLLEALRAYCALHGVADVPNATERKGQFEFSDGTKSHIRMFEIDPENAEGNDSRETATIMQAVENGELVLLVRHNNKWEELHKFLRDHTGGKKIDTTQIAAIASTADDDALKASLTLVAEQPQEQVPQEPAPEPEKPQVVDVMADAYEANWEEEDEDDEDNEEEEAYQRALWEAQQAEAAARAAALQAQHEQEAEFKRTLDAQKKMKQSYLQGADLSGDMGEILNKVRSNMGTGDFDPETIDPEKANFSAIINTSDYKRFRDVTLNEIQVMTNDDLERLAEYTAKQEFFYLTALAVKMTHELSYSSAFQVLTNQELWKRAIEQNIPFHRFYNFIHNEITKSYLEQSAQERLNQNATPKDGANLRSHREVMLANIKERQKQKMNSKFD